MKFIRKLVLISFALLPSLTVAPPPVGNPQEITRTLQESVDEVRSDGTRDLLGLLGQAAEHDGYETSAGSNVVPLQSYGHLPSFPEPEPGPVSFVHSQYVPSSFPNPSQHPFPVQYSYIPALVYQPVVHLPTFHATGPLLPHDVRLHAPIYPQNIHFEHGLPLFDLLDRSRQSKVAVDYSFHPPSARETMPFSRDEHSVFQSSSATDAAASGTRVSATDVNEHRTAKATSSSHGKTTVPEDLPYFRNSWDLSARLYRESRSGQAKLKQKKYVGTDPLIQAQAVQDIEALDESNFKVVLHPDPEIDSFVDSLRMHPEEPSNAASGGGREGVSSKFVKQPNLLARTVFYNKMDVKQVNYQGQDGLRPLFLTHSIRPNFLLRRPTGGHLGVWEIGPSDDPNALGLYLRGFFPFPTLRFQQLDQHPAATGKSYYFWQDRPGSNEFPEGISLRIAAVNKIFRNAESKLPDDIPDTPELVQLQQTGQLQRVLKLSHLIPGRHLYAFQEHPETATLLNEWLSSAGRPKAVVQPIRLTEEQVNEFAANIAPYYRVKEEVKAIRIPGGMMYMLSYLKELAWLKQHLGPVLIVWKLGPNIQGKRLMIAEGIFRFDARRWSRLTPESVPGLSTFHFSYSTAQLPQATATTTHT